MADFTLEQLTQNYADLMAELSTRLQAAIEFSHAAIAKVDDPKGFIQIESGYLQVRKVCEVLAVAVLIAHNEWAETRSNKFMKQWSADLLFGELEKLNPEAFPRALRHDLVSNKPLVIEMDGFMTLADLKEIYGILGDRLHTGALRTLIKKKRNYSINEFNDWLHKIYNLLQRHIVMLPAKGTHLTVMLATLPDGMPDCAIWKDAPEKHPQAMRLIYKTRGTLSRSKPG